ncbi:hypothetical protein AWY79_15830 [Pseudodesulfovibrio indicus]|uniref:Uncharacterized protein n=1 Tax=Pseudodesulfovibrio indicus TaxID=1716143 RepID=A0ABN4M170_9BACT|nr:hypothetical protein AWY79_15830 [Pseudodesulfovibrio indicus]
MSRQVFTLLEISKLTNETPGTAAADILGGRLWACPLSKTHFHAAEAELRRYIGQVIRRQS